MELGDQRLLRAAQSRTVTLGEFNFDNLTARPLMSILDMNDISKLETIATSIRYAGNPSKKKKEIQKIMVARGFDKAYMSGTNRVTYKYYDDPSIVVKVAIDDIGRQDNPREFFNQNVLKPFVTKVFEVAGDGVVALTERVKPIQSREEFMSIADDVHKVIWILTKRYILADFGSRYFMNWGIRQGWGPVLLDSPYCYEPNRDMLICHAIKPDGNECGGLIDYDEGFNSLICNKCGAVYRASEIAKILKENEIIVKAKERGNVKMRVGIVRGGNKVITLDTTNNEMGIIRPATDSIVVPKAIVQPQQPEVTPVKTVKVNINTALVDADEKRTHRPGTGRVSIKRTAKKRDNNHGGYNKAKNNFNENREGSIKVKVARGNRSNNNFTKKEHVPVSKGAVAITAVNIEELANTQFTFSSYDAENGLVFASGKTPSGSDIKIHLECKDATEFAKELGVESEPVVSTTDNTSTVAMELEQAKKDLLNLEEENISLKTHIEALKESLEASRKTIDAFGEDKSAEEEISRLTTELEALRASKEVEMSEDLVAKDTEIVELSTALELANKRVESLELNIEAREATIADLNKEIESLKEKQVIKSVDASSVEQETMFLLHSDMYNAVDFLSEEEKPNYEGPNHILAIKDVYEADDGSEFEDFVRDNDGKILCVSHINGVPVDCIKFENGTPAEE